MVMACRDKHSPYSLDRNVVGTVLAAECGICDGQASKKARCRCRCSEQAMARAPGLLENQGIGRLFRSATTRPPVSILTRPAPASPLQLKHSITQSHSTTVILNRALSSIGPLPSPEKKQEDGRCGKGVMDGGDERGRSGGAQGPGRTVPLELRSAIHPPDRQGQRSERLVARQEPGAGDG
jgi:hypothetical protein